MLSITDPSGTNPDVLISLNKNHSLFIFLMILIFILLLLLLRIPFAPSIIFIVATVSFLYKEISSSVFPSLIKYPVEFKLLRLLSDAVK